MDGDKIEAKLVLITNRKSHMSFRLVPNSVTLDDLERHNSVATSALTAWYRGSCSCPASEHEHPRAGHGADATVPV